jgi:hypothetical protein
VVITDAGSNPKVGRLEGSESWELKHGFYKRNYIKTLLREVESLVSSFNSVLQKKKFNKLKEKRNKTGHSNDFRFGIRLSLGLPDSCLSCKTQFMSARKRVSKTKFMIILQQHVTSWQVNRISLCPKMTKELMDTRIANTPL